MQLNGTTGSRMTKALVRLFISGKNYLFEKSKDPDEIKEKMRRYCLKFSRILKQDIHRQRATFMLSTSGFLIMSTIGLLLSDTIQILDNILKDLGDKKSC